MERRRWPGASATVDNSVPLLRVKLVIPALVPEMILADSGPDTRLVILEGHVRATAMAMAGGDLKPRTALLGRSKVVADQWFY
jgi:hypothetical protein